MDIRDAVSYLENLAEPDADAVFHTEDFILFHCQLKYYSEFKIWAENKVEIVSQQYGDYRLKVSEEDKLLYFVKGKCLLPTMFILRLL